jgi:hypothetical protein
VTFRFNQSSPQLDFQSPMRTSNMQNIKAAYINREFKTHT